MTTGRKRLLLYYWPTLQSCQSPKYVRGGRVAAAWNVVPRTNREKLWVVSLSPSERFFSKGSSLLRHFQRAVSQMDGWNKLNLGRSHLACEPISHGCTDQLTDLLYRTQYTVYPYDILSLLRLSQMSSATYFTEGPHQILSVWPHLCFYSYSRGTADSKMRSLHPLCYFMVYLRNLYFSNKVKFPLRWIISFAQKTRPRQPANSEHYKQ